MRLESLMNNVYAWLFLSFCTIAAFLFGIYTWIKGQRKKEISYLGTTYKIFQKDEDKISELNVKYKDRKINDFSITKYAIWNSGNEVIEGENIVVEKPLKIRASDEETVILDVSIVKMSEETNGFFINNFNDKEIELKFSYVEPNSGVIVQIMHMGARNFDLEGKIKGGKELKNIGKKMERKTPLKKRKKSLFSFLIMSVILEVMLTVVSFLVIWNIIPEELLNFNTNSVFYKLVESGILSIPSILVIYMVTVMFKKEYFLNIPESLRKVMNIDIHDEVIPDNVVMHGLKQRDGKFIVRIFGVNDNPKENRLFGMDLEQIEKDLDVKLWPDDSHTLWSAALYPEADTIEEAVSAALNLYAIVHGEEQADLSAWKAAPKKSLCSGFNDADPDAIIAWNRRMADLVAMDEIAKAIRNKVPAAKLRKMKSLTKIQKEWLERRIKKADFSEKMRLHYYLGVILDDEDEVQECFRTIQSEVLASTIKNLSYNENARIVTEKHTVKLPLRVNWGGGWSDTPPYCNENGGTVLNVAILLNGQKPVEVTLEKISEKKIVFDSRDMDVHGEFDTIEPLQATGDPFDPFALQKACLLACEIIPKEGSSLEEILDRLGGGFEMHSEVTNVPKGSGLGTSSILSAACVKAVFEFMGIAYTEEDLYAHVLAMEQIMSTGGGWQDQVGGITPGLKYITSMPGIDQKLKVTHVEIPEAAKQELSDRFVLIYTGQRRLARNLLRDVVGRYVGNEPESLFALEEIQKTAALMRFELERGNVDGFASLLDYHWELSKKVDAGSSNTLIEQIFSSIEELIDGKLVCGAGGGGFLQVILKKGVTRQQVEERLNEVFMDSLVGVADCRLVWE